MTQHTQHTPGPWRVEQDSERPSEYNIFAPVNDATWQQPEGSILLVRAPQGADPRAKEPPAGSEYLLAEVHGVEANARLIASAPELKAELNDIAEAVNTILDNWTYWTDEQKQKHLQDMQVTMMAAIRKAEGGQ